MVGNARAWAWPTGSVNTVNPRSGVSSNLMAVTKVRDCPTWMARQAPKVRHHQRAMPSVWGRAWNISAIGAPAIRTRVSMTRTA
jgi:hypothetical protein